MPAPVEDSIGRAAKVREALLGDVGMLMLLVRAEGMKVLDSHDADNSTEDTRLFEIDVDKFGGTIFDMFDGLANVAELQLGRQCD